MGPAGSNGAPFDILFVCFGNICRSPMAEGLARDIAARCYPGARSLVRVSSAGVGAQDGNPPTPEAVEAMAERGIDISSHRARKVTAEILAAADLVLAMEQRQGVRLRDMGTAGGPVQVLMKLGEAARGVESLQAGRGAEKSVRERLERLRLLTEEMDLEGLWQEPEYAYDVPDPIGLTVDGYVTVAARMEAAIGDTLRTLLEGRADPVG